MLRMCWASATGHSRSKHNVTHPAPPVGVKLTVYAQLAPTKSAQCHAACVMVMCPGFLAAWQLLPQLDCRIPEKFWTNSQISDLEQAKTVAHHKKW